MSASGREVTQARARQRTAPAASRTWPGVATIFLLGLLLGGILGWTLRPHVPELNITGTITGINQDRTQIGFEPDEEPSIGPQAGFAVNSWTQGKQLIRRGAHVTLRVLVPERSSEVLLSISKA
jgi:hypothetical protein